MCGRSTGLRRIYLRTLTEPGHGAAARAGAARVHRAFSLENPAAHGPVAGPTGEFVIPATSCATRTARAGAVAQEGVSSSSSSSVSDSTGEAWWDQSFQPSGVRRNTFVATTS